MAQLIIDVSEHNGVIDWQQVKDAGYHAIIRAGFGRFDSGGRYDYYWDRNASECERLGIPYGVYWYSYATRTESAQIEAQQCLDAVAGRSLSYPIFFDTEEPGTQQYSYDNTVAFCSVIESAGYWAGVYASESWWTSNLSGLEDKYTTWIANWSHEPTSVRCDLWQRSGADGDNIETAPGVGPVDMNVLLRETLLEEMHPGETTPEPEPTPDPDDSFEVTVEIDKSQVYVGDTVKVTPHVSKPGNYTYNYTWSWENTWQNRQWGSTTLYEGQYTTDTSYEYNVSIAGAGTYYIYVYVKDEAGNVVMGENTFQCLGERVPETPEPPAEEVKQNLTYQQRAAEVMRHMCTHDGNGGHGYSQYARWGDGTYETLTLSDGTVVSVPNGDFDCSSACITAWETVLPGCSCGATYTGDMRQGFLASGLFVWHPMYDGYIAQTGDIYLNEVHHTAMCWSAEPDILMQFSISENGTISGVQGDQTGAESNIRDYYDYPWDGKLVYVGPQPENSGSLSPSDPSSEPAQPGDSTVFGLDEDGYWGADTTRALQTYFGTAVDGEVWHQWPDNAQSACTSGWQYDYTQQGSPVIRALQNKLGVDTDGILGANTISVLQKVMGTVVDGTLDEGSSCVAEMQRRLNAGTF